MIGNPNLNKPGNVRVIRYGEVYLMLAEAYLRGTNPDEAKAKYYIMNSERSMFMQRTEVILM